MCTWLENQKYCTFPEEFVVFECQSGGVLYSNLHIITVDV